MTTDCKGNFWGDGNTLYFDCGSGSMATTYICQNSYTYAPKTGEFYCVEFSYTSINRTCAEKSLL